MLHEPAVELGVDHASKKKEKLGKKLFVVYLLIYSGFVAIGLISPDSMGVHVLGKQNLAIVYGFGLIILAIIMGFIYNYFCSRYEDMLNKTEKETKHDL